MALPTMRPAYLDRRMAPMQVIANRRERENASRQAWTETTKYFQRADLRSAKDKQWNSLKSFETSMSSWRNEATKNDRADNLQRRRAKLRNLVLTENTRYEKELHGEALTQEEKINTMRNRASILKTRRETERQQDLEDKRRQLLLQNNHELKNDQSERHRIYVEGKRREQIEERDEEARLARKRQEMEDQQRELQRKQQAREDARKREAAARRAKDHQEELLDQISKLKVKEREAEKITKEKDILVEEQQWVYQQHLERQEREEREKKRLHARSLRRQHKAQLLRKSREVQESLEHDLRLLEELAEAEAEEKHAKTERRRLAKEMVEWMKQQVADQLAREQDRENELDSLYRHEAERMYEKQEAEWEQERNMREKLMNEVLEERQQQLEAKLEQVKEDEKLSIRERAALVKMIEDAERDAHDRANMIKQKKAHQREIFDDQVKEREQEHYRERLRQQKMEAEQREAEMRYQATIRGELSHRAESPYMPPTYGRRRVAWN